MKKHLAGSVAVVISVALCVPISNVGGAQQQPVGVVTGLQGQAQLTRPPATPLPLRFKDGVIIRDIVDTREKSLARILFGGRSTVTVRELTRLEVREEILPTGQRRDVHELSSGAILVNVARQLMRPGDEVIIRTPNAVAAVRGSLVFALYDALLQQTIFAVLFGSIFGGPLGVPPVLIAANTGLNITGSGPGAQVTRTTVTEAEANQILAESQVGKTVTEEANQEQVAEVAAKEAANLANAVIEQVTQTDQITQPQTEAPADTQQPPKDQDPSGTKSETAEETKKESALSVPIGPSSLGEAGNIIKNSGFETVGSIPDWVLSGAGSSITGMTDGTGIVTFGPTDSRMAIIHTGTGSVKGPTGRDTTTLKQTTSSLTSGTSHLIRFDYNFLTREFPDFVGAGFNDKFTVTGSDGFGGFSEVVESVDGSAFKTGKEASGGGFTLAADEGFTDWKQFSKTVVPTGSTGTLEFKVEDVGDDLFDSAVLLDNVVVKLDPPLYLVINGETLVGPSLQPLVEVKDQSVTFDSVLVASGSTSSVSLSGSLLKAENSNLTVPFSLLGLLDGSTLSTTSSDPLVWLRGGDYSLSQLEEGTAIFDFWGTQTAVDPDTGAEVGSGKTVTHAGALLEASNGAAVDTQKVLKLDTALLEATAPVISLIGSPNKEASLTTQQTTIDLIKAKVVSNGPVVALDKGLINVNNGALINLTHGSYMNVKGDLLSLVNGSKINVVNGPLISVAGLGSTLDVSGALANFGGTGGNKIIVNNSIAPTATLNGLPVSATLGGAVNISGNAVKNPDLGTISVTGSLISANNNGKVNIQGK